ncbi:MAG: hypothetical protein H6707_06935 [Deltaproteobacteria bacterium]|nr:hypothetical protein [Deltaproteobacteria bacterium]
MISRDRTHQQAPRGDGRRLLGRVVALLGIGCAIGGPAIAQANPVLKPDRQRVLARKAKYDHYRVTPLAESFADRRLRERGLVCRTVLTVRLSSDQNGGASARKASPFINPPTQVIERDLSGRQMERTYTKLEDGGLLEEFFVAKGVADYMLGPNRQWAVFVDYTRKNVVYPDRDRQADYSEHHATILDIKAEQTFRIVVDRQGVVRYAGQPTAKMREALPELKQLAGPFRGVLEHLFEQL